MKNMDKKIAELFSFKYKKGKELSSFPRNQQQVF